MVIWGSNLRSVTMRATGVMLGISSLAVGAGVGMLHAQPLTAAPLVPVIAQSTQSDRDNPGDVVIETEPQQPDATQQPGRTNPPLANTRFSCQVVNGEYTVMYNPESQPNQFYAWAKPTPMGGGWSSERRCNEISRRLEAYRPDGLLEMRTGLENGYNVVCVTTQQVPACRIVLTVPQGQDATQTRDRVFENIAVADRGQQTTAVNTFAGGNDALSQIGQVLNGLPRLSRNRDRASNRSVNLRPYLDQADGGTGQFLRQDGLAPRPGLRLNPDRFR